VGAYAGPDGVESGLVLALDAGNSKSYPGSGATWTDLSGRGNNGTLTNGPTYSSTNGGSFSFDGVDDWVNLGNISLSTTELTVSAWLYDTDTSGNQRDFVTKFGHFKFRVDSSGEGGNLSSFVWIGGNPEPRISASWTKNVWINVAFTWNTGGNFRLFTNGNLRSSSTNRTGTLNTTTNDLFVSSDRGSDRWKGNISQALIYNRALTAGEIAQNFNATRSRYSV
jgi:hypothetical protein